MVPGIAVWRAGILLTASGIGAGAFGAHSLASRLEAVPKGSVNWSMASNYAIVNGSTCNIDLGGKASERARILDSEFAFR